MSTEQPLIFESYIWYLVKIRDGHEPVHRSWLVSDSQSNTYKPMSCHELPLILCQFMGVHEELSAAQLIGFFLLSAPQEKHWAAGSRGLNGLEPFNCLLSVPHHFPLLSGYCCFWQGAESSWSNAIEPFKLSFLFSDLLGNRRQGSWTDKNQFRFQTKILVCGSAMSHEVNHKMWVLPIPSWD